MPRAERERKIQEFAESQGWTAAILDAGFGTRVILGKLESGIDAASTQSVSDERLRKRDAAEISAAADDPSLVPFPPG
jgi:hypothetical protein